MHRKSITTLTRVFLQNPDGSITIETNPMFDSFKKVSSKSDYYTNNRERVLQWIQNHLGKSKVEAESILDNYIKSLNTPKDGC